MSYYCLEFLDLERNELEKRQTMHHVSTDTGLDHVIRWIIDKCASAALTENNNG